MAVKRVAYVEPENYFPPEAKRFAEEWERTHAKQQKSEKKTTSSTKKKK